MSQALRKVTKLAVLYSTSLKSQNVHRARANIFIVKHY